MSEQSQNGPLAGYRVLELGSTVAGPFCGRVLADFGAEVVKVEPPAGDHLRRAGKRYEGTPLYAKSMFRNKKLVSIDLRESAGQELVRKLAQQSDVLIENFRPGSLERWGLGYDALSRLNPGLIMVRISGYGQTGPKRDRRGYGIICEAFSGLRNIIGYPGQPPARVAMALTDYITGLYGAFGAMTALVHRQNTGTGQIVDTALYECAFSLLEPHVPSYDKLGFVVQRVGSGLPDSAVNNLFETRDGQYIHIQGSQDPGFKRLVTAMGQPELLEDERFAKRIQRAQHQAEIDAIVQQWMSRHDLAEVEQILESGGVTAHRINTMAEVFEDAHFRARDMLVDAADEELGSVVVPGVVPKLSASPGRVRAAGGRVGQDTRAVLTEISGLTDEEIDRLEAQGVVCCDDSVFKKSIGQT